MLPCLFWGRCQIPRLGVSCSSGAAFRVCFFLPFLGGDAKSLAWVFLARRVLPFVLGKSLWICLFWGAMPNPSLGCFLLVGCCLSCWGSFLAFFGGDAKSLAWVFLARRVLTKWMVMGSVYLELFVSLLHPCVPYYPLRAMEHHFVVPKCPKSVKISPSSQVLPCLFWGRCQIPRLGVSCSSGAAFRATGLFFGLFWGAMPNPSLGCFLLVGCCLSCLGSFVAFFGGDAKSLAWVFLARRVLPFVFGFFFCLFLGRPNPSLGCFLLVGCLLNGWSMGSVYLELFETKPCCIRAVPHYPLQCYGYTIL